MTYKNFILNLFILIVLASILWITFLSFRPQVTNIQKLNSLPDAFMENVTTLILDKAGNPKIKIMTPKMIHYQSQDTTRLFSPQLMLYRNSPEPWIITSQFAKSTQGVDNVTFWNKVLIHHLADKNNPETIIKTAKLQVQTKNKTAQTNEAITLIQPNFIIKSQGLFADLNSGNIKLLTKARGEYVPRS